MPDGGITEVLALAADLKRASDDVKKVAETTNTEIKNLGAVTDATKAAADAALLKHGELSARMDSVEQWMSRASASYNAAGGRRKSLGEIVTDSDEVKGMLAAGRGKASVRVQDDEQKAIISGLTTDAAGSAGDLIVPDRRPGIIEPMVRRLTVRDLIMQGRTNSTSVQYVRESGFVNNAATVSETSGATKPQSDIKFDVATSNVTTIAHWVLATRQILSDVPQLQSYINGRLMYGLKLVEENQLLMGGGTGTDLTGIYTQAVTYAPAFTLPAGATMIDLLRMAILQSQLAELPANGIVLNPIDWARIEMTKDANGAYLFANPTSIAQPRIWNLPVVPTTAMTEDTFLTGAFGMAAQIFDRWDADILISTEDADNFRKNLVTILCEERLALATFRPEAFIKGDFGNVT